MKFNEYEWLFRIDLEKIRGIKKKLRQKDVRVESYDHSKIQHLKGRRCPGKKKIQTAITRASDVRFSRFFF